VSLNVLLYQSDKDTPHYVHIDVLADVLLSRIFHFKLHSDTDAPQYVHTDVLSDVLLA